MDLSQVTLGHIMESYPHMYKKCPSCGSILKRPVDDSDQPCQSVRCSQCAPPQHFCWSCLGPWVFSNEASAGSCSNKSCGLVATLLNCDMVVDKRSAVFGCPLFRACPKCRGLIMHIKGCKNVKCSNCKHCFCFICLEAIAAGNACSYDICKKGRAGRQRFVT
ncbi:hypothetical protein GJAV_G00197150 [Gymnothorax javanicus]|nr:hypothetical protein GJAV_G00197150 [Gymnothorax javanicus]